MTIEFHIDLSNLVIYDIIEKKKTKLTIELWDKHKKNSILLNYPTNLACYGRININHINSYVYRKLNNFESNLELI